MRPTKCTAEVVEKICHAIKLGLPFSRACEYAGVSESTGHLWKERAQEGEKPFSEFMEQVRASEAQGEATLIQVVQEASKKHWSAAAWILERRHADRWAKRAAVPLDAYDLYMKQTEKDKKKINNMKDEEINEMAVSLLRGAPEFVDKLLSHHPELAKQVTDALKSKCYKEEDDEFLC